NSQELTDRLLKLDGIASVTFVGDQKGTISDMVQALKYVMLVLVASSAALCFVVLYSLIAIALEERKREIATIKVLGLFDYEAAMYMLRENVPMIAMGIAFGILLGFGLQRFVITTIEVDVLMFSRDILLRTYLYSAALTALFALLVNIYMYRDIAKVDMISSLKSVE
ncbi:MAG: ABC transporter permease, partial [Eubacteriaceae bacterium]|nr:ABC transporter permease [Eubacteriaceae bacterium]